MFIRGGECDSRVLSERGDSMQCDIAKGDERGKNDTGDNEYIGGGGRVYSVWHWGVLAGIIGGWYTHYMCFLIPGWQFNYVINHCVVGGIWGFGYRGLYRIIDRGVLEKIGPKGAMGVMKGLTGKISTLQSGAVYNYVLIMIVFAVLFIVSFGDIGGIMVEKGDTLDLKSGGYGFEAHWCAGGRFLEYGRKD